MRLPGTQVQCAISCISLTAERPRQIRNSAGITINVRIVALTMPPTIGAAMRRMTSEPVPPPTPGFIEAMGRTNDAIIYGGRAHLYVEGDEAAAKKLAEELPSANSKDYGKPFAEIFAAVNGDFYQIDPMLFSPAKVTVTSLSTGKSFEGGAIDDAVLNRSFS